MDLIPILFWKELSLKITMVSSTEPSFFSNAYMSSCIHEIAGIDIVTYGLSSCALS
jgi:hypothetical protein